MEHDLCQNNAQGAGAEASIHTTGSDNRIVGNHLTGADIGLDIDGSGNYIANNTVKDAFDNYDIVAGNHLNILFCEIPESIDWPANVTLAGSLTMPVVGDGLTVSADDVTVDLAGHALIGSPGSNVGRGISILGETDNVVVRNGTVHDFGAQGILGFAPGAGHEVIGVRLVSNGREGLRLAGEGHLVKDCTARGNGGAGFSTGANSAVTRNRAVGNTGVGIVIGDGSYVMGNVANNNGDEGISTGEGSTVAGNTTANNVSAGIRTVSGSTVTGNTAHGNQTHGIVATGSTVIGNTARANQQVGICITFDGLIDQNMTVDNVTNMTSCSTCTFGVNHAP